MEKSSGRVIAHTQVITLEDVSFFVSESGRQRVLREKRKNVHAFVEGVITDKRTQGTLWEDFASYNPYRGPYFTNSKNEKVEKAKFAVCWADEDHGRVSYDAV